MVRRILTSLHVQHLLMLEDAFQGRSGSPKVWDGKAHYRYRALSWNQEGVVVEVDLCLLVYCRTSGVLQRAERFGLPPLTVPSRQWDWEVAWQDFRTALLGYEQQFGPERLQAIEALPVPPLSRAIWWSELGSRVPGRLDDLLGGLLTTLR